MLFREGSAGEKLRFGYWQRLGDIKLHRAIETHRARQHRHDPLNGALEFEIHVASFGRWRTAAGFAAEQTLREADQLLAIRRRRQMRDNPANQALFIFAAASSEGNTNGHEG
jgi:hypothetical protein